MTREDQFKNNIVSFGFWMYLMTDFVLFASLFAVYAVLRDSTFGGPAGHEIFSASFILAETLFLLTSSMTAGLAFAASQGERKQPVLWWLFGTFILGSAFLIIELSEFRTLATSGHSWQQSAFLSSYFTLVGTHGLHIFVGLLWLVILGVVITRRGLTEPNMRKLFLWSMFWHFLDVVWIFIFSIVYMMGLL